MNADSINKVNLIDSHFIQSDCKAPYLTSTLLGKLDTKAHFDTNFRANIKESGDIKYKMSSSTEWVTVPTSTGSLPNPVDFTANDSVTGYLIDASSSTTDAFKAFTNDIATEWASEANYGTDGTVASSPLAQWISIQYQTQVVIKKFTITVSSDHLNESPKSVSVYGGISNGSTITWIEQALQTFSGITFSEGDLTYTPPQDFTQTNSYNAFKFVFNQTNGGDKVTIKNIVVNTVNGESQVANPQFISNTQITLSSPWSASSLWKIDASSSTSGAYNVFNNSNTGWSSSINYNRADGSLIQTQPTEQWISIKYPQPVIIKNFNITSNVTSTSPTSISVYGGFQQGESLTWTSRELGTFTHANSQNQQLTADTAYNGFKFVFNTTNGGDKVIINKIIVNTVDNRLFTTIPTSITAITFKNRVENGLLTLLNTLRICYNLLDDPAKFSAYKSQSSSLTIENYENMEVNLTAINDAMNTVFYQNNPSLKLKEDRANFEAIKRLIKAYEYIIHIYIAMTVESSAVQKQLTSLILEQLNAENNSLHDSTLNSSYASAQEILLTTENKYNNGLNKINDLDINLEDLKEDLNKEKQQKTTNSNILNKNTIVYYVFLVLFVVLASVLLYVIQTQDEPKSKLYVGGVIVSSIVAIIIIYFLNMTYLKEGFSTEEHIITNLQQFILEYLTDTVNISLLINNSTIYNDVLHVMNKEIDRYDVINHQLKLEATGTNDVQVYDYRSARVLQYRVYLLLQIIIILSIAMFIYLYTGENIILFGITILLVLLMIYIYIMNTHSMVRTDATKIYWGQPSMI